MTSLRARLTAAVMMPLLALALTFGGITCWMIDRTISTTADRILVGSANALARVIDADPSLRKQLLPLAVRLLHSRSTSPPLYSIHQGERLIAGTDALPLPPDYDPQPGASIPRHEPAYFPRSYGDPLVPQNYSAASLARDMAQPAYLHEAKVGNRTARIATEIRILRQHSAPILIQVADFIEDRQAYKQIYYFRVAGAGVLIVMIALLLFYGAITWGLEPFATLTAQIDAARRGTRTNVRVILTERDPLEARLLATVFNDLMARTERATQSLRQFTADASHQLRTPLAILRIHADLLLRCGPATPEGATALADISGAVDSLDRLLSQLIALARMDEQSRPQQILRNINITELAATVVSSRVVHPDAARMDIGFEASEPKLMALGDDMLVTEMLSNLLDNAIVYNKADGTVTVRVLVRDGLPVVEVEDDGPGIALANRERVWERFYRVPGSGNPSGSGLGLPIVRALGERIAARTFLEDGQGGKGLKVVVVFQREDGSPAGGTINI